MLKGGDWYYPDGLPGFHKYHKQAYAMALKKFRIKKPVKEWFDGYVDQIVEYVKQ